MFRQSARALCKRKRKRNEFKLGSVDMASVDKGKATKEQKYDRQLRLWGDHGQDALENAHVCLINASATGTEILKNLVLPGIGAFTIVDDHKVRGEDVGNNFFLTKSSIGRNRAQAATELLQELNSDVSGNFVEESPEQLLDNDPDFFHRFSLVIAVHLPESTLLRLAAFVWGAGVPLLVCRTYGLIGYMRLVVKEHTVVESHPDNALEDLRLDHPFPELKKHIQSYDLENMEKRDHSHTPWVIVMAKYLEKWRSEHNKQMPKSYKEKEAFRELIRQGKISQCHQLSMIFMPSQFRYRSSSVIQTSSFWLLVRALKEFVEKEGQGSLPVRGTIPDMIADSDKFIKLQNVYREKAKEDATAVSNHISALLQSVGRLPESVSEQEIRLFCKSSAFLRVVRCRSLAEEYSTETINKDEISSCMDNPDSEMVLYLMLRAVDKFYQQHGRYPGVYNYQVEEDIGKLKSCVNSLLQENGLAVNVKDDYIHEFCRYGAVEPHTVASFVGGKSSAFLRVVRCRSLAEEYSTETINKDEISSCMDNPDSEMVLYLMLRAVDKFYQQHGRYPGVYNYQVEEDIGKLKSCVNSFLQENGLAVNVKHDYIHEFCRYGAVEPHPVASFVGGSAAQDAIKIITHQFVPFNNTFIYNAMAQTSATFQL
ncbi:UNVERIFIED_CONTAM: hypothetical protein FKN15_004342 [Acipenser sinensis]